MNKLLHLAVIATGLLLTACGSVDSDESTTPVAAADIAVSPQYRLDLGLIPFPNDLYFAGTEDGTLNLPLLNSIPSAAALNALDGFSTNAPINIRFNGDIDAATIVGGSTAHIFEVIADPATKATIGFVGALIPGVDYSVAAKQSDLVEFTLLKSLNPKSAYLVALTAGITNTGGAAVTADDTYQAIKDALASGATLSDPTTDVVKQLVGAHLAILGAVGVSSDNVLVSASFSTQSTTDVLEAAASVAAAQGSNVSQVFVAPDVPLNTSMIINALPGIANIYAGTVETQYYLDPNDAFETPWQGFGESNLTQYNPMPVGATTLDIPTLVSVPNASSPWYQAFVVATGATPEQAGYQWPLVIFQHGITGDRTNAILVMDAFASAGFAVISIDQPLHGITDTASPLYQAGNERTFDLDKDGDGAIDSSGTHSINLEFPLVGRDNSRQASLDLHYLAKTAPTIDINGDTLPDFDGSQMHFVGQSLGSMVGIPFLAINTDVISATLSVPGGGIATLLRDSESFGPILTASLQAAGLPAELFDDYWRNAQTVVDSSDPLSYAADAALNHPILMHKVLGDTVVPNTATDKLIAAMGLPIVAQLGGTPGPLGAVSFKQGGHSSLLDPTSSFATTTEMQTQAVIFAAGNPLAMLPGNGQVIYVQNADVVKITAP